MMPSIGNRLVTSSRMTTPSKAASQTFVPNGVYYGIVRRVEASLNRVWVEIPRVAQGFQFGPVAVVGNFLPSIGDNVACVFVENSTESLVVVGRFLTTSDTAESALTATSETTSQVTLISLDTSLYRSAKFLIQATDETNYLASEIMAIHDDSTAWFTEYARINTSSSLGTFDVSLTAGSMNLLVTPSTASLITYKIRTTTIPS